MAIPVGNKVQSPLNLILPINSWVGLEAVLGVLHLKMRALFDSSDEIGTLHFARFVNIHQRASEPTLPREPLLLVAPTTR